MKFKFKSNLAISIVMYVMIALQAAVIFLVLSKFFGWFEFESTNLAVEILEMCFCSFVIVLASFYLSCNYLVKDGKILARFGFFDLFRGQLVISNVRTISFHQTKDIITLEVEDTATQELMPADINIKRDDFNEFYRVLAELNPNIIHK